MTLSGIVILVILGIILIIVEIFFIPGIGVIGIIGIILLLSGVIFAYQINSLIGHLTFASSVISGGLLSVLAFRTKTWEKVALKKEIDTKIVQENIQELKIGDIGKTVSRLAPSGKALLNNHYFEVRTSGEMLNEKIEIEVIEIERNRIVVKSHL